MSLEETLSAFEERVRAAHVLAKGAAGALHRLERATQAGTPDSFDKDLAEATRLAAETTAALADLEGAWTYDLESAMTDGRYLAELSAAANGSGLRTFVRDDRLYSFPLLLRAEPRSGRVRVGGRAVRTIRPSFLVKLLAKEQRRPLRFKETAFLGLLFRAYQTFAGEPKTWGRASGPVVPLRDLHERLTLHPDIDYPIDEFGRDLLLLDRKPDLRVREFRFEFPSATVSKGGAKPVTVFDENGTERSYFAIRFVRETAA